MDQPRIAGLIPWLPWPLCRWRWWTDLVRAERLAALRIGLALVLLVDLLTTYAPHVHDFYGADSLSRVGDRDVFQGLIRGGHLAAGGDNPTSAWYWSLWRGFGHPVNLGFFIIVWLFLSAWIACRVLDRAPPTATERRARWAWLFGGWMTITTLAVLGFWARIDTLPDTIDEDVQAPLKCATALVAFAVASALLLCQRLWRRDESDGLVRWCVASCALTLVLLTIAGWQWLHEATGWGKSVDLDWLLLPWETNPMALRLGIIAAGITTFLLLIGCWTRLSALVTWVLMGSFDNLNHYVTDSGETIRYILLFYVVLTPGGAVWSLDSLRRRDADHRPVYVSPWALRVMFIQLVLIYFMTGLYKISGDTWHDGQSLYRVMANPALTRIPYSQLPVTYAMLDISTRLVLFWELSFPLLVLFRWTRVPALIIGALLHLGIWLTMEIGFFGPYMLCFYLPMLPWEKFSGRR